MEGKAFGFFFAPDFVRWLERVGHQSRLPFEQPRGPAFLRLKVGHAARLFPASPGT